MPIPGSEQRTLAELVAALHAEGLVDPDEALAGAELLVGWESAVVRAQDGWIYRFSRIGEDSFHRELAVLRYVDGRLPVPSPRVERVGTDQLVMVYRTITGHPLDLARVVELAPDEREPLTRSLAVVLAAMHDSAGPVDGWSVPHHDHQPMVDRIRAAVAGRPVDHRRILTGLLAAWERCPLAGSVDDPVLLHGDYHPGNMVFSSPTGALTGIWDFSCVVLGDPADDFRYLVGDSYPVAAEVATHYTRLTGRLVDLEAARLVGLLEAVCDAIDEGRPVSAVLDGRAMPPG